jgi:hypothetical protein
MHSISASRYLLPALFLALGLWLAPLTILGTSFTRMPGEPCDAGFSNYVLEHGYRFLRGLEPSFFSAPFLYPFKDSIALSDNFLSTLPVYSAFRLAGLNREGAYQLWFLSLFVLNFVCAWYAFTRLRFAPVAAALGAYLFAFMAPVLEETTHPALLHLFAIPLAVCGFTLWAESGSARAFAGMCLAVVLQFYGAFYLGTFLVLALALYGLAWLCLNRGIGGEWTEARTFSLMGCLAGAAALLWPLASPYLEVADANRLQRFWTEVAPQLPTPADLFRASTGNLLWGWTSKAGEIAPFNNAMHVGLLPWLCLAGFLFLLLTRRADKRTMAALAAWALLAALTLNIGGASLFRFLQGLPVFQAMRALTRVVLVESFFVVLPCLAVMTALARAVKTPWMRNIVLALFCLVAMLDQYDTLLDHYGYEKDGRSKEIANIREDILRDAPKASAVAYLPSASEASMDCRVTVAAMLASQDLGVALVNGYTSWFPRGYGFFRYSDCAELEAWMLRTQSRSDTPLFTGLGLAGPGAAQGCAPAPSGRDDARTALLRRVTATGAKEDLIWALSMKGFSVLGKDELWMGRRAQFSLRSGESLVLEGVSLAPLDVRMYVDGKDAGKLSFWGLPNRVTLFAPGRDVRYTLVADKAFTAPLGNYLPEFPEVSVIFTKVGFRAAARE